ncbi:MAG: hypothetical protein JXR23_09540 [Pontiellaceae bacterium]|nr:hypothetical protein [Pontiellaceae bacterium]
MKLQIMITIIALMLSSRLCADTSDELIIYRLAGDVPVKLMYDDQFAVMLVNDGNEQVPIPRYILAIKNSRTVIDTTDIGLFKMVLSTIPKGSVIFEYDKCTVTGSWGLTAKQYQLYYDLFEDAGLSLDEERRITCNCREG